MASDIIFPEMIHIPAGEFLMGSNDTDASKNEKPLRKVFLGKFYFGKYPVTNGEFLFFLKDVGGAVPKHWKDGRIPSGKENHPLVNVSWNDAFLYTQWLKRITGKKFRLSNELEWEKAARGTDGRRFPWGNDGPESYHANFNDLRYDTSPVGQYERGKSPYGCYDMAGNVAEWCDWSPQGKARKKGFWDKLTGEVYPLKGGSWGEFAQDMLTFRCSTTNPGNVSPYMGFRCAMD